MEYRDTLNYTGACEITCIYESLQSYTGSYMDYIELARACGVPVVGVRVVDCWQ